MPVGYKPTVFVSSTCFDLGQVRSDIRDLIHTFGLEPILSEYDSFPVSPDTDTISNCLRNVREKADIFVLIIGGRYGFQTENGKSITNLEYLEAKKKGIPIYVFVNSSIMNILPIWKNNPDADFSSHVENQKVFEFVESVSHFKSNWVYKFDSASEIKSALLQQIPYLFMDSLEARKKLKDNEVNLPSDLYPPKAARLVIEKPDGWEHLLFAFLCKAYLERLEHKKFDLEYGISFNDVVVIEEPQDVFDWITVHNNEMLKLIRLTTTLVNEAAMKSFGEPGEEGDYRKIQHVCQRLLEVYEQIINWKLSFTTLDVNEDFEPILKVLSGFADDPLAKIEQFINRVSVEIPKALESIGHSDEHVTLNFTFVLESPDVDSFNRELEKIGRLYL
ncbi:TPA: DUF4062 domain-containing protein [Vibrio parahaemolyticus]|uniref:DUF4062 domain-containing protein n=1 Tax=Vibrio parahaemolyticus TaxID=670 RepID=UPI00084AD2FF|nr:DUF4062 domain-containing protein [Vibrio parahaemolyticus]EGQ9522567.1 DUF4062 domain-containing protein [Vibrio parahaemolyticus]EHJ9962218.1 DUF4062 domain-containing protein [Vibrio parahaemolyticus]EHK0040569.1 DUF4062 domain-containing protein [Vibrio parahaemolyticus]EIU7737229.1 DUF4062 domain-containing protein [Vibrio parahaemolyticus]EJC7018370.1 DUF4062 domain-containing protein [Vibrio parahaemolyticus]